jgi:hypothetical protein
VTNRRGNQTGHELDLPSGETLGDLFNPGHAPGADAPRSELVDIDAEGDISDGAKVTLGRYLRDITSGKAGSKGSQFVTPVEPGQAQAGYDPNASSRGGPEEGRSMLEEGKTQGTYLDVVEALDPDAVRLFRETGQGDHGGDNPFLETSVSDYGSSRRVSEGLTGHTALPGVRSVGSPSQAQLGNPSVGPAPDDAPILQQKVSSILSANRFSQVERAFVMNSDRTGTGVSLQGALGQNDRQSPEISDRDLSEVGTFLLDRAAGRPPRLELAGVEPPSSEGVPIDLRATGAPVIPVSSLRAGRAAGGTSETSDYVNLDDTLSYSTLNTDAEPFVSVSDATLNIILAGITKVLSYATIVQGALGTASSLELLSPGLGSQILRELDLPPLRAEGKESLDWHSQFILGMQEFYGVVDINNLSSVALRVQESPGYYVSVSRNAMRDLQGLTGSISSVQSILRTSSVRTLAAGTTVAELRTAIEGIRSSATWRFIVSMVALGDRRRRSAIVPDVRLRSRPQGQRISWRHHLEGRAAYVLPSSLTRARSQLSDAGGLSPKLTVPGDEFSGRRLDPEDVREIEDRLEGEYVPFYFHDVRTNEVIGFHAFLSSLTDGFAANYNSTTGYGRAEDVMVYNNTKRSIGFDFHLVATSKDDHDALYWNVNKLVSMLYPQYSRGRTVVSGDQRFIQPFSQIPTASPLVRIRIGDVVKSNYSRFGLARLFGLGQDTQAFSVSSEGERNEAIEAAERRAQEDTQKEIERLRSEGPNVGEVVELTGQWPLSLLQTREGNGLANDDAGRAAGRNLVESTIASAGPLSSGTVLTLLVKEAQVIEVSTTQEDPNLIDVLLEIQSLNIETGGSAAVLDGSSSPRLADALGDYRFMRLYVPIGESAGSILVFTPGYEEQILNQKRQEQEIEELPPNTSRAIREFFSPGEGTTGNPIVRSFESSRGRGMAGFITGMTMDWADSTWEIDKGSRAPISLKISVTFSPIHDIPLGLDSDGAMRAVAYGVGRHSNALGGDPYDSE